ncbi:MAG: DUF2808 domain-containing protein, partial [Spirochaetes bacterium]|nr:DUF2808 domain-containing protein [Spirochaetota bacterium]
MNQIIKKILITALIFISALSFGCGGDVYESLIKGSVPLGTEYPIDPGLQDSVFPASDTVQGGTDITITSAGDAEYEVWFAPVGTAVFVAGSDMTYTAGNSTTIAAPADEGVYQLYIVYPDGTISAPSNATLTVDNTPPVITAISTSQNGPVGIGDTITFTITLDEPISIPAGSSIEVALNNGGTIIVAGPQNGTALTGTYTVGSSDSSTPPALDIEAVNPITATGTVTDLAGNILNETTPGSIVFNNGAVTVDTVVPVNQDSVFAAGSVVQGSTVVTITSAGDASYSVWFAPAGILNSSQLGAGATMTTASGTATQINAPQNEGTYYIYVVDDAGNISSASASALIVDNTAPSNQNIVFVSAISKRGVDTVTIVSSGDITNQVWFAPAGFNRGGLTEGSAGIS